jgi:thioredoxin 1
MWTTILIIVGVVILAIVGYIAYSYRKLKNAPPVKTSPRIKILNKKNFHAFSKRPLVLIDFWAPWCAPCKIIAPTLNEIAEGYPDLVTIGKLNVDHNQEIAQKFKVQNIPTLLVFKKGKVVKRIVGVKTKKAILNELKSV